MIIDGRLRSVVAILVATGVSSACHSERTVSNPSVEPLLVVPHAQATAFAVSPDGALFFAAGDTLYRAHADSHQKWKPVAHAPEVAVRLLSLGSGRVYAVTRACNSLHIWDETGWHPAFQMGHTPSDPHKQCDQFFDVWGTTAGDVFAVGQYSLIAHLNGSEWKRERTAIESFVDSAAPAKYRAILWAVGGDSRATYAAGTADLLQRGRGVWDTLPVPRVDEGRRICPIRAIAAAGSGQILFGGGEPACLLSYRNGTWRDLTHLLGKFRGSIFRSTTQDDGTALLWSFPGDVIEVSARGTQITHLTGWAALAGVAVIGDNLYVAGSYGDNAIVGRIRR